MKETRFISFYSYKGGVGRSLALANLAWLLALEGRKVLIIDMDLEAPGQHRTDLFNIEAPGEGTLEMLSQFREIYLKEKSSLAFPWEEVKETFFRRSPRNDELPVLKKEASEEEASLGGIWLMPSGALNDEYYDILARWNWEKFYEESKGTLFFDMFKELCKTEDFDDVLIDSRTGLSDVFYVSTLSLSDTVVVVTGFNRQNLEGTDRAFEFLTSEEVEKDYGKRTTLFVGSPEPGTSNTLVTERYIAIGNEYPHFKEFDVILPYVVDLALEEKIFTLQKYEGTRLTGPSDLYVTGIEKIKDILAGKKEPVSRSLLKPTNPFMNLRSDNFDEKELFLYFVDPGNEIIENLNVILPTIVYGSRGSGKTMLAKRLSYGYTLAKLKYDRGATKPELIKTIGLYFRQSVDTLRSFDIEDEGLRMNFNRLFEQYLDVIIFYEALNALDRLGGIKQWGKEGWEKEFFTVILTEFAQESSPPTLSSIFDVLNKHLASIRIYINNPLRKNINIPFFLEPNVLMKHLIESLLLEGKFGQNSDQFFIVLIDEYENFRDFQQKIVNTRLKQAQEKDRITYKFFLRSGGLHTNKTKNKEQPIQEKHDFREFSLENNDNSTFSGHMKKVANRYLEQHPYYSRNGMTDIDRLLKEVKPKEEAKNLKEKIRKYDPLENWIEKSYNKKEKEEFLKWFKIETDFLRKVVGVVIYNQKRNKETIEEIIQEFQKDTQKSREWVNNYEMGALFWLCSLYSTSKMYVGFGNIVGISGNNIRVFLDFCYGILAEWLKDEDRLYPIPIDIQNKSIRKDSEKYLEGLFYIPQNPEIIERFTQRLGRIWGLFHKSAIISEPEINHFQIENENDLDKEVKVRELLKICEQEAVLRGFHGYKQKTLSGDRPKAYQLNPRFAPHFNFSWRKRKSFMFNVEEVKTLFLGKDDEFKALFNDVKKRLELNRPSGEQQSF